MTHFVSSSLRLSPLTRYQCRFFSIKSAVCTELGKPLDVKDTPEAILGKNDVAVQVKAAGINFADILQCKGLYQVKVDMPFVPGFEVAGYVSRVGSNVTQFKVNDPVIALPLNGGGYSEECVAGQASVLPLPSDTDPSQMFAASALMVNYGTAHLALRHRACVKPGDTVFVSAAAGGVGLAAVELAKLMGCRVIAAAGGPEKLAIAASKGADELVDYRAAEDGGEGEGVKAALKRLTGGRGVDVALDMVGGSVFDGIMRSMAWEGRLVVIGFASGQIGNVPANLPLVKNCSVMGLYWGAYMQNNPKVLSESAAELVKWWGEGKLTPHVSDRFPLEEVNTAMEAVANRKSTGKVVVEP